MLPRQDMGISVDDEYITEMLGDIPPETILVKTPDLVIVTWDNLDHEHQFAIYQKETQQP